jgi:hypothetical protein
MNLGRTVFAQLVELLPPRAFELAIQRHRTSGRPLALSCMDQLLCMIFAQLTGRSSLRETVTCLRAIGSRRYRLGIRHPPARSTLADANERAWPLRLIRYVDPTSGKRLSFLTNHLTLEARQVALLYRKRWKIELLFKWMKQHLHVRSFFGTTPNAVKSQLWIAVITLVLIHRLKQRLGLRQTPNEIAQILSVTLCEKTPVNQAFLDEVEQSAPMQDHNQMMLFGL